MKTTPSVCPTLEGGGERCVCGCYQKQQRKPLNHLKLVTNSLKNKPCECTAFV